MRVTVLGSGTSFGLPQIGCDCHVCTSRDPRDSRTRSAVTVDDGTTRLLIDTPPELRLQLINARIASVDAVVYTHDHADHVHGIDDLRPISLRRGVLPVYGLPETLQCIADRFPYIFDGRIVPPRGTSKPQLEMMPVEPGKYLSIGSLTVLPLELDHGSGTILGYRIGRVAYLTDVKSVPQDTLARLDDLDVLLVSGLLDRTHPTHFSIDEAVEFARAVGANRTYLTHLTHIYTHAELIERLPEGIDVAYDGLNIDFDGSPVYG